MTLTIPSVRVRLRACQVAAVALCVLVPGLRAAGQTPQPAARRAAVQAGQPYRGLFGAGSPAQPGGHAFDLQLSAYQEYGNTRDDVAGSDLLVLSPGWFTGVRGGLWFQKAGQHAQFGLRTDGSLRYYRDAQEATTPRYRVEMAVDTTPGSQRHTEAHFSATFEHEPYYILPLFASTAPVSGGASILPTGRDDLNYPNQRNILSEAFAFDHEFASRTTFGLFEDVRYTRSDNRAYDARMLHAGARLGHRVTRYAAIRLGYGYRRGDYGLDASQRLESHDIDLSLDYRRPLPRMRRTTFGFTSGSTLVSAGQTRRWEIVGTVNLRHDFDRGWFVQGDFRRDTRLVEGFADPLLENTVLGSLGGFFGRRVELLASGGYSRGSVGFGSDRYRAYQGSARLRLALARYVAVDVEGLRNHHEFDAHVVLPDTLLPRLDRWAVRCNLSLWLPVSR